MLRRVPDGEKPKDRSKIAPVTFRDRRLELRIQTRQRPAVADSMGLVAKRDLQRLYDLIDVEAAELGLSVDEACMVCDALQGVITVDDRWRSIWAEVDDGIRNRDLQAKWGVSDAAARSVVDRLRTCPPSTRLAVCDAAERFWILMLADDRPAAAEAVVAVGLVRADDGAEIAPSARRAARR
jgi:hypothetical protein